MSISPNLQWVMWGAALLGAVCGLIGSFAFIQRRALAGDAMAHAALPGVTTAFLIFQNRAPIVILGGAFASCIVGYVCLEFLSRRTKLKQDAALAIVLSLFFALGIFQLSLIQKRAIAGQSGLDKLLFGQAASLVPEDIRLLGLMGLLLVIITAMLFRRFELVLFDRNHAAALGVPVRLYDAIIALLLVSAVVVGLQLVGVVLMAAMLMTPAASARYWCTNLRTMVILSALLGAASGVSGALISYAYPHMPTGPWMVVVISLCFTVSLLFAPRRGIIRRLLRSYRVRTRIREENVLRSMYKLEEREGREGQGARVTDIIMSRNIKLKELDQTVHHLRKRNLISSGDDRVLHLTEQGRAEAARITRRHRLWELYLTRHIQIPADHVHADAEEIEHFLTPELEARLAAELGEPTTDPHGRRIPEP